MVCDKVALFVLAVSSSYNTEQQVCVEVGNTQPIKSRVERAADDIKSPRFLISSTSSASI
jgi:hypothetical protein